jgi:hypothetical protein
VNGKRVRSHRAHVWAPIDRIRRPWHAHGFNEPAVIRMEWSDEALTLLVVLREILAERIEVARACAETDPRMFRHYSLGLLALDLMGTLIAAKPRMLIIEPTDFVPYGILMFLDAMVGTLREAGPVTAGTVLRNMGWRTQRADPYYSPNPWQHPWAAQPGYAGRPTYYSPYASGEGAPAYHSPTRGGGRTQTFQSPDTSSTPKTRLTFHSPRAK